MIIDVINLDSSSERLREFQTVNSHLKGIRRFAAIDGATQDIASLIQKRLIEPDIAETYRKGALGNALSHLALWERAVASREALTICEDDAIFNHDFHSRTELVLQTLGSKWDIVLWGWNFDSILYFVIPGGSPCLVQCDQDQIRKTAAQFQRSTISPQAFRLLRAFGALCYSISPKGADALRRLCFPIREMAVFFPGLNRHMRNIGIDVAMNDAYSQLFAFVSFPPLAVTKNETEISTIQNRP